jgi:hypothetical protein
VKDRQPVGVAEAAPHDVHVRRVVLDADVLEHADRVDAVERLVQLAVVLEANLDRQPGAALARQCGLLA